MSDVRLSRRITFSSGHRYWIDDLSPDENRELFGAWASRFNHGHNYVLVVTAIGPVEEQSGMVVNIKLIDAVLQERIVAKFDQRSINDEIPEFASRSTSLESLVLYFRDVLRDLPGGAALDGLRLWESQALYANWNQEDDLVTITRVYEFAAAHRLHIDGLSDDENARLFGKCNNPSGHGHNYVLEVTVGGPMDSATGFVTDISKLDEVVAERVIDRYDHKHLNEDVAELAGKNPTSEVVAIEIFRQLEGAVPGTLESVRLRETARNMFEVRRGDV